MTVYIVDYGVYCENVNDELPVLKQLVAESVGTNVRRVGRFIQLALIGAGRAARDLPEDCAVYLCSGRGDMGAMIEVLDTIYRDGQSPRPLSFINTVSNAACFYVAQTLGVHGASSFISNRYFAMEMALKSAVLEMQAQRVGSVLLGAVDMVVAPASEHRQRLKLAPTAVMAEGSHWLQLTGDPGDRPVLARVEQVRTFGDRQALSQWLGRQDKDACCSLAMGQYMDEAEAHQWQQESGIRVLEYRKGVGHFDSQVGRALCHFLEIGEGRLFYLNRDPHGRYAAIVLGK